MNIALIGNPNCGKTTLFNALTGTYQKVGNWSGVTTEKKEGEYFKDRKIKITDLPGVYSLSAESKDEQAVINYLKDYRPDCIINVVDGTKLERNLYLSGLLISLGVPMIIAVNFSDELKKSGIKLNAEKLSDILGVKAIEVSALKKTNIGLLIKEAKTAAPPLKKIFTGNTEKDYLFLSKTAGEVLSGNFTASEKFTVKADKILTGKYSGIPIFVFIIIAVYFLSLKIGGFFGEKLEGFLAVGRENLSVFLLKNGVAEWLVSLFCDAVIKGLSSVTSFLPQILVLFFLLTLLEESGYMARVSFNLDRIFRTLGLSGKSVIPFVLSCGCTLTGVMATRTIAAERERKTTVYLCPFMPCGAKTAVFGWLSYKFFGGSAFISAAMYFLGIFTAAAVGFILKGKNKEETDFILEMPDYRRPSFKDVYFVLKEKVKDFLIKSGTVIFAVSVILWIFISFGPSGYVGRKIDVSFAYYVGNAIKYLFYPLGFCDWKAAVSVISGIFAKEAVIETAELLSLDFYAVFKNGFTVFSFMSFILLSPPCAAALSVAKKELGSVKDFLFMIFLQITTAYLVALIINAIGIITANKNLLLSAVSVIIIIITAAVLFSKNKSRKKCSRCGENICKKCKKQNTTI